LNALTLSIDGKDIVVYDSKATRLRELLEKYNIKGIPVDIYEEVNQLGKIRCCTNYKTSDKNTVDLLYN
jgi:N-dimethylarginine dimethylaminohydrolase